MNNKIREAFGQIHATEEIKSAAYYRLSSQMRHGRVHRPVHWHLAAALVLLFLCIGLEGWHIWNTPVSYLSVDVNPSVELVLNRFDCVMHAEGRNDAGRILLSSLNLNGKGYIKAVELLVESELFQPYLTDSSALTFTVASPKAEQILKGLENSSAAQYHGTCIESDVQTAHEAHHCGVSLGKYQIYLYLSAYDPSITLEDCEGMSMHELNELLSAYEAESDIPLPSEPEYDPDQSHHSGHHGWHHGY